MQAPSAPRWRALFTRLLSAALWLFAALAGFALEPRPVRADDAAVVNALRAGGVAVLLRHAETTPGAGDPPGYDLRDCATQRNLSTEGRARAVRIGQWFKRAGVVPTVVRNSPWCRTRDTADLAFGRSRDWDALANLYENPAPAQRHVGQVLKFLGTLGKDEVAVLVSHGSSISAFVGEYPAQGEGVVVRAQRDGEGVVRTVVIGRLAVP